MTIEYEKRNKILHKNPIFTNKNKKFTDKSPFPSLPNHKANFRKNSQNSNEKQENGGQH